MELTNCKYKHYCKGFMPDYCNDRDLEFCLLYKEHEDKEIEQERQKALERWQYEMADIGQIRQVKQMITHFRTKEQYSSDIAWSDYT